MVSELEVLFVIIVLRFSFLFVRNDSSTTVVIVAMIAVSVIVVLGIVRLGIFEALSQTVGSAVFY